MDLYAPAKKTFWVALAICAGFFLLPLAARAATLSVSPSSPSVSVGQSVVATVFVSSPDEAINAVSGDLAFPSNILQVTSILERDSVIGLWIRNPSFTNSIQGGNVHFEGIVLNPGFTGSDGVVIKVIFQAVQAGNAAISFTDGSVLANDGNGTDVLDSMTASSLTVTPAPPLPVRASTTASSASSGSVTSGTQAISSLATTTIIIATATTPTSTVSTPPVVISCALSTDIMNLQQCGWSGEVLAFCIQWGVLILLIVLLAEAITFVIYITLHRLRLWHLKSGRELVRLRESLRTDLQRIEKELKTDYLYDRPGADAKKVRAELERLEKDLRADVKKIDDES